MENLESLIKEAEDLARANVWDEKAVLVNKNILEINKEIPGAYTRLARCYTETGDLAAAKEMYEQVLKLDQHNKIALFNLSNLKQKFEKQKSEELIRKIGEMADYTEAFNTGLAARNRGSIDIAIIALDKALQITPASIPAKNSLAKTYRMKKEYAVAEKLYLEALDQEFNKHSAVGLAEIYKEKYKYAKAAKLYEKVLEKEPKEYNALYGLGIVSCALKKWEKAENSFMEALNAKANDKAARNNCIAKLKLILDMHIKEKDQKSIARLMSSLKQFE